MPGLLVLTSQVTSEKSPANRAIAAQIRPNPPTFVRLTLNLTLAILSATPGAGWLAPYAITLPSLACNLKKKTSCEKAR